MDISLIAFALLLALAFANGTNDVSKAIATLVGSGVTNYHTAIAWGTAWTVLGAGAAAFVATAMVQTFSNGFIEPGIAIPPALAMSVLIGAMG
ncbi:MAG: inorganic phosphate transporter, partial [Burkholderiales bacterium]